jgi:phytoene/squalene synthetase
VTGRAERAGLSASIASAADVCRGAFAEYVKATGVPVGELAMQILDREAHAGPNDVRTEPG